MKFQRYTKDDKATRLYIEMFQPGNERPLDSDEDWPGTSNNLESLRVRRASGESWDIIGTGIINTEEEKVAWENLTAQIDADIAEAKGEEEEESEEEADEEDEA